MASNNFYLNSDPLLFGNNSYKQTEEELKSQLNDAMIKYRMLQQQQNNINPIQRDYIEELDKLERSLNESTIETLNKNGEYKKLYADLQAMVQKELLMTIKTRLNSNSAAIKNIERQMDIINDTNSMVENEQRKNLNELNDYVKNYSNITFDEYKKRKNKVENENTRTEK